VRLFQIGEVALGSGAAMDIFAALLSEQLLTQHPLKRGELNVEFHTLVQNSV
jgi:hypothetical protein